MEYGKVEMRGAEWGKATVVSKEQMRVLSKV